MYERHLYIIGKSGTGKSTFLQNLILQNPGGFCHRLIKSEDCDIGEVENSGKSGLASSVPPDLREDTGRDVNGKIGRVSLLEQRLHLSIGLFDRDQRPGV